MVKKVLTNTMKFKNETVKRINNFREYDEEYWNTIMERILDRAEGRLKRL